MGMQVHDLLNFKSQCLPKDGKIVEIGLSTNLS